QERTMPSRRGPLPVRAKQHILDRQTRLQGPWDLQRRRSDVQHEAGRADSRKTFQIFPRSILLRLRSRTLSLRGTKRAVPGSPDQAPGAPAAVEMNRARA